MPSVLIIDDEDRIREVVQLYFEREGFDVMTASDGVEGVTLGLEKSPDLIILDLMLPRIDGLEVFRRLRSRSRVPIIMLTAKDEEADRVVGLELGADDYVTKPFSPRELVARAKAVLRRGPSAEAAESHARIELDGLMLDRAGRTAKVAGETVHLTPKEFDLLWALAERRGTVLSREVLMETIWGYRDFVADPRTVDTHMKRLRHKVAAVKGVPWRIATVWGAGYKLVVDE